MKYCVMGLLFWWFATYGYGYHVVGPFATEQQCDEIRLGWVGGGKAAPQIVSRCWSDR